MSMDTQKISHFETLLGRELSAEEKDRLRRIKDTLQIADNDALWDVIVAMEYQRTYYEELPERISKKTMEIFDGLSQAVEQEVTLAQSRLAESVVKQAENLSMKMHLHTWLKLGALTLVFLLLHGSFLMWIGFRIGTGQTQPPAMLFRMPIGFVLAGIGLFGGVLVGMYAARSFSEGNTGWKKNLGIALVIMLVSMLILCTTV